jgi:hypothetical protein
LDAILLSSFFSFVILLKWQSFVKIFSQVFGDVRNMKGEKPSAPFHVAGSCDNFC